MSQPPPSTTTLNVVYCTFVIRLTWDRTAESWNIHLKPINGEEGRLFGDLEALLRYLEAVMRDFRCPS
jgi:hypothetical protein